jgi:shikimate kinase
VWYCSMTYGVVIRGPLGVGKSTVAAALAKALGGDHIRIDQILEEHGLEE